METAELVLGLGSGMALSLGLGWLLARLLWSGLLRGMCACMHLARPASVERRRAPSTAARSLWASARS